MRWFIHSDDAAFGLLDGDNRGFSFDPNASCRMIAAWNTDTGRVSFTVTRSTKKGGYMSAPGGVAIKVPDQVYPAREIGDGKDNFFTLQATPTPGALIAKYRGLNGALPLFHVDGNASAWVTPTGQIQTKIAGDDYPDFEAIQYRQHDGPRGLGTDSMGWLQGVGSVPLISHRDESWVDGQHQ
jgi:hypothetical protein